MSLSINEFIKQIEKEFGPVSYRAVSPEGKVYEGWKDKKLGADRPKDFKKYLGIPEDKFVIPCLDTRSSDWDERGFSTANSMANRKGKRK